jgi:WD40 repeat protein
MRQMSFVLVIAMLGSGAHGAEKHRVLFNRFAVPDVGLFIADADGNNEHSLVRHDEIEYSPNLSLDGKWVVLTSEHNGLADIYRVHPDGSGLERLTDDPAFDDQGALSPDNATLAFVSTRGGGIANIWPLNFATHQCRNLTGNGSANLRPGWLPDGRISYVVRARDESQSLKVTGVAGGPHQTGWLGLSRDRGRRRKQRLPELVA